MAILQGLRLELVEIAKGSGAQLSRPCEEYRNIDYDDETQGRTCYQYVCLRPGRTFIMYLQILNHFDWADSDAICLHIDFDACTEVFGAEVLLSRHDKTDVNPALMLSHGSDDLPLAASISRLTRLVKSPEEDALPFVEEEVSFSTALLPDESSKSTETTGRHGEIWIAVYRCKLEKRAQERPLIQTATMPRRPSVQKLKNAGIYSRIECIEVQRRAATMMNVRATNKLHVCQFVFLYRTPEQFQRVKDEEKIGGNEVTTERMSSPLFEPEDDIQFCPTKENRESSVDSLEASTIVVSSPEYVTSTNSEFDIATPPAAAIREQVSKTMAEYMAKFSSLKLKRRQQQADFLSLDSDCHDNILELEAELDKQKADDDNMIQMKRDECEVLRTKIASQKQRLSDVRTKIAGQKRQLEEDMQSLEEEIQDSEQLSYELADFDNKRRKMSEE